MKKDSRNKHNTDLDQQIERLRLMRDEEIDTSDIPELQDWSKSVVGKFYRPVKEPVTLRLDADVIAWFKREGPGYQTRINSLLRSAMTRRGFSQDQSPRPECGNRAAAPVTASRHSFHFPTLEKHGELDSCNKIAGLIAGRGSIFAPTESHAG